MGVGIRGEACVEGAEHFGHDLDVHSVLECDGGEDHEICLWDARPYRHSFQHTVYDAWQDGVTRLRGSLRY